MRTISVDIHDKIAVPQGNALYVCGNGDYVIAFSFDSEWDEYEVKTARFEFAGVYKDVTFTGNKCAVPAIYDVYNFNVGVYADGIVTTTPACIPCMKSILCGASVPAGSDEEGSGTNNAALVFTGAVDAVYDGSTVVTVDIPEPVDPPVKSVNGQTGAVNIAVPDVPVKSVNGKTGAVVIDVPVKSVNGKTGAVTVDVPVKSVNGKTGAVVIDIPEVPVKSVNGQTGAVVIDIPEVPVKSVNGKTGAVTIDVPVTSVNGKTGAVVIDVPAAVTDAHINALIDAKLGVIENGAY